MTKRKPIRKVVINYALHQASSRNLPKEHLYRYNSKGLVEEEVIRKDASLAEGKQLTPYLINGKSIIPLEWRSTKPFQTKYKNWYNKAGKLIKRVCFSKFGDSEKERQSTYLIKYDKNNHEIQSKMYGHLDNEKYLSKISETTHGETSSVKKTYKINRGGRGLVSNEVFDSQGNLINETNCFSQITPNKYKYEYDKDRRLIGKFTDVLFGQGRLKQKIDFEYNSDGQLIKKIVKSLPGTIFPTTCFEYNSDGDVIRNFTPGSYFGLELIESDIRTEYEYRSE